MKSLTSVALILTLAAPVFAQQAPPAGRDSETEKLEPRTREFIVPRYVDPRDPPAVTLESEPETRTLQEWFNGRRVEQWRMPREFTRSLSPCIMQPDPKDSSKEVIVCNGAPSTTDRIPLPPESAWPPSRPKHPDYGKGKFYPATPL